METIPSLVQEIVAELQTNLQASGQPSSSAGSPSHSKLSLLNSSTDLSEEQIATIVEGALAEVSDAGLSESEDLIQKKHSFFRNAVKKNALDIKFTCFLFNSAQYLSEEFRRELLGLFLSENAKFEDFQTLDYELTTRSWSGSRVPILERERNFLESLLPLFNSIQFLEHKSYVEQQRGWRKCFLLPKGTRILSVFFRK